MLLLCTFAAACGSGSTANSGSNRTASPSPEKVCEPVTDTPTEAYKRLYAAVKEKNTEKIKGEVSAKTQELAESLAQRQNNPIEKVYENGFTATTFSPTLPEIRDERIAGCWAGVEVRNTKDERWEDLPFTIEDGRWKFALGELFGGSYKSPGKSRDEREREASNTATGNPFPQSKPGANSNANVANANVPKYDGPQVEPLQPATNKKK